MSSNELEHALIVMYANSMKASRLSNERLVLEVFDAFADEEIQSWRDALLNELVIRFQSIANKCSTISPDCGIPES